MSDACTFHHTACGLSYMAGGQGPGGPCESSSTPRGGGGGSRSGRPAPESGGCGCLAWTPSSLNRHPLPTPTGAQTSSTHHRLSGLGKSDFNILQVFQDWLVIFLNTRRKREFRVSYLEATHALTAVARTSRCWAMRPAGAPSLSRAAPRGSPICSLTTGPGVAAVRGHPSGPWSTGDCPCRHGGQSLQRRGTSPAGAHGTTRRHCAGDRKYRHVRCRSSAPLKSHEEHLGRLPTQGPTSPLTARGDKHPPPTSHSAQSLLAGNSHAQA